MCLWGKIPDSRERETGSTETRFDVALGFTAQAALATEAQDYRGDEAVALGLADASGHALDAFESFAEAMGGKK